LPSSLLSILYAIIFIMQNRGIANIVIIIIGFLLIAFLIGFINF